MRFPAPATSTLLAMALLMPLMASAAEPSTPEATFRAGTTDWVAAYNAGDVDRIMALYAPDAVVMPPDKPAARGHAATAAAPIPARAASTAGEHGNVSRLVCDAQTPPAVKPRLSRPECRPECRPES